MRTIHLILLYGLGFAIISLGAMTSGALAETKPIRNANELFRPVPEKMVRVTQSRVIVADYDLIRKDFSQTSAMTDLQIDTWLLDQTSFISLPQSRQLRVNTKISTTDEMRMTLRPAEYRRGIVFEVEGGLIDAKGTGSIDPAPGSHDNGLATLGDMIREYAYEKLVDLIFKRTRSRFSTVGSYAVIDYGFDVIHEDRTHSRAGYILRQAHNRLIPGAADLHRQSRNLGRLMPEDMSIEVETQLRRFGITTTGANRSIWTYDMINAQGTKDGALVDFGAFLVMPKFFREVRTVRRSISDMIVVWPAGQSPEPDPRISVPSEVWGTSVSGKEDPKWDNPFVWSHELAASLANHTAGRESVLRHLSNLLGPVITKLDSHPDLLVPAGEEALAAALSEPRTRPSLLQCLQRSLRRFGKPE